MRYAKEVSRVHSQQEHHSCMNTLKGKFWKGYMVLCVTEEDGDYKLQSWPISTQANLFQVT